MYLRALAIAAAVHPRPSMALGLQVVLAHHRHPAIASRADGRCSAAGFRVSGHCSLGYPVPKAGGVAAGVNLGFVLTVAKVGQRSPGG
jgi:hypothetical protein